MQPYWLAVTLVGIAAVFAGVAICKVEDALLQRPPEQANELSLFRVTAAFQDPNHSAGTCDGDRRVLVAPALPASLPGALAPLALPGAGLWLTYSQSSVVALAASRHLRWRSYRRRSGAPGHGTTAVLAVGAVVVGTVLLRVFSDADHE